MVVTCPYGKRKALVRRYHQPLGPFYVRTALGQNTTNVCLSSQGRFERYTARHNLQSCPKWALNGQVFVTVPADRPNSIFGIRFLHNIK